MRGILLDADAFRCLRELGLLEPLARSFSKSSYVACTEYVARMELSAVARDVTGLEQAGHLQVHPVKRGTPEFERYRVLCRQGDKGEAEAIAWALEKRLADRPVFVTRDNGATRLARQQGVPVTDVLGLTLLAVLVAAVTEVDASTALQPWEVERTGRCRPTLYEGVQAALTLHGEAIRTLFSV